MSRSIRTLLREMLEYAQKKGGPDFASELNTLFSEIRSSSIDEQVEKAKDQYIENIKKIRKISVTEKHKKLLVTANDHIFRIYFDRNKKGKLFLIVDYWRKNELHYCYQLISNSLTIAGCG